MTKNRKKAQPQQQVRPTTPEVLAHKTRREKVESKYLKRLTE